MADTKAHITDGSTLPRHIAVIMDGNGRWAVQRRLPRVAGHQAGANAVRRTLDYCMNKGIEVLSLFAFSSENWQRPAPEVKFLMDLFSVLLVREVKKLHKHNVQFKVIGSSLRLSPALKRRIQFAEQLTENNTGLKLLLAVDYGGRWDILQATRALAEQVAQGTLEPAQITEQSIEQALSVYPYPPPDLLIRTSGEQRISNFMLWHLAYSELYFTDTLWPDFGPTDMDQALAYYASRERRFGCVNESPMGRHCA